MSQNQLKLDKMWSNRKVLSDGFSSSPSPFTDEFEILSLPGSSLHMQPWRARDLHSYPIASDNQSNWSDTVLLNQYTACLTRSTSTHRSKQDFFSDEVTHSKRKKLILHFVATHLTRSTSTARVIGEPTRKKPCSCISKQKFNYFSLTHSFSFGIWTENLI